MLSASEKLALQQTAQALGVPAEWLAAVINFETAGTWDPKIKNKLSSARGLIQFLDATAQALGFNGSLDLVQKHPTVESQLKGPVLTYLKQFGPFRSKQSLWLSIFLPKYRNAPLDTIIYADDPEKKKAFRAANPGVATVGDYYHKLEKSFKAKSAAAGGIIGPAAAVLALGFLAYKIGKTLQG